MGQNPRQAGVEYREAEPAQREKRAEEKPADAAIQRGEHHRKNQQRHQRDLSPGKPRGVRQVKLVKPPGEAQKIAEYFGVSEEKLNALPADKVIELRDNGALGQIYAHLLSLVGWDRLVALALSRATTAANA